jgi:hypothetical protein
LQPLPATPVEVEIVAKLKRYKSPDSDQIPAELIQAGGEISTNLLILFGMRKNYVISGRSLLLYQFTKMATTLTEIVLARNHCYQFMQNFIEYPSLQVNSVHR